MDPDDDLRPFLHAWPYDEDDTVRFLTNDDGTEIMQIRLPLGVEQYDVRGRPDGKQPYGKESFLQVMRERVNRALMEDRDYVISEKEFSSMRQEGILYYLRYLVLFQIGRYERVIADTAHNLELCDLVDRYYDGEDQSELLQYRPYIWRIHGISRAMEKLERDDRSGARKDLERCRSEIQALEDVDSPIYQMEKARSLQHIEQVLDEVGTEEPSPKDRLEADLRKALEDEDYERAARIRDQLRGFRGDPP
jgi:hypothetical protein